MSPVLKAGVAGVLIVLGTGVMRADDQAASRALLDKAIRAMGGEEKLAKRKALTLKAIGKYYGLGQELPFIAKYAMQLPDRFRFEVEGAYTVVLNGDKGWIRTNNETRAMTPEELAQQKAERYVDWITTLIPLKEKGFTLTPAGETKVDDRAAVGVKVSHKDRLDVTLYFDKETGLLVKRANRTKSAEQDSQEVDQETIFGNYQEMDGVKVPIKVTVKRDGKLYAEADRSDIKAIDKLDDSEFVEP